MRTTSIPPLFQAIIKHDQERPFGGPVTVFEEAREWFQRKTDLLRFAADFVRKNRGDGRGSTA